MVTIRNEFARDIDAREALLDRVWGPARLQKTAERLREGRSPPKGFPSSPRRTAASSARSGSGTSAPGRPGRLCCSGRSQSRKRAAASEPGPP